ncbi:MAG: AbrB/MazE/SpoVT family DNA-binding domain-containing protein [Candidatus Omnitrophota bacterium]
MTSTVSVRGQLVIPSRLRTKYNIKTHSKVEWIDAGKVITLVPIPTDVITSSRGILKQTSTKTLLQRRKEDKELEGTAK